MPGDLLGCASPIRHGRRFESRVTGRKTKSDTIAIDFLPISLKKEKGPLRSETLSRGLPVEESPKKTDNHKPIKIASTGQSNRNGEPKWQLKSGWTRIA